MVDAKDKAFARFLIDLPAVPSNIFTLLRELCVDTEMCVSRISVNDIYRVDDDMHISMPVGFTSLRELVTLRPPVRGEAMKLLLDLTTHPGMLVQTFTR